MGNCNKLSMGYIDYPQVDVGELSGFRKVGMKGFSR